MQWKDIGRAAAKVAPLLGTVLGGPAGGAVGGLVAAAFGVADDPASVAKAMQADPNAAIKLREIETRHKERLEELALDKARIELDTEKAFLDDRSDARRRDVAKGKNDRATWMIVGDVIGLIVCLGVVVAMKDLPGEVRGILSTIAGIFGLGLRDAHQFEFGSSRGSKDKDREITGLVGVAQRKGGPG